MLVGTTGPRLGWSRSPTLSDLGRERQASRARRARQAARPWLAPERSSARVAGSVVLQASIGLLEVTQHEHHAHEPLVPRAPSSCRSALCTRCFLYMGRNPARTSGFSY
jgi:hypothetical protein